jgi:anti-sigma B factor antagonist
MGEAKAKMNVTEENGVRMVEFTERKILDELTITQLGDALSEMVNATPKPKLLLNFKNVEHLSSAALGMLITLDKQVKEQQGQLKLSNIRPQIFEVFKITRLNKLFEIHDSAEVALQSF